MSHKKGMGIKAQLARRAAAREALLGIARKKERAVPPPVKRTAPMSNSPRRMPPPKMIDGKPSRAGHICPVKGCDGMSHRTGLCVCVCVSSVAYLLFSFYCVLVPPTACVLPRRRCAHFLSPFLLFSSFSSQVRDTPHLVGLPEPPGPARLGVSKAAGDGDDDEAAEQGEERVP